MRQAAGVMAALLAMGMVWPVVAAVGGGAADSAQASESAEAPVAAPVPIPEVAIPSMPAAKSAEAEASEPVITPPPPVPEVEIPAIPPVDPKYPFKQSVYKPPVKKGPAPPLEEGKRIFDREGRFDHDAEGNPVFVFDSGDTPMRLLESRWREYLESVTDEGQKHARWRISGIVTLYYQHNYLLLTKVVRIEAEEERL
ncbi:MAG TPA: hypothetical protein VMW52_03625 [Phycisphaerae bacterium]|nr:hypothetical protein [Phycisphaerae bacterium]